MAVDELFALATLHPPAAAHVRGVGTVSVEESFALPSE